MDVLDDEVGKNYGVTVLLETQLEMWTLVYAEIAVYDVHFDVMCTYMN